MIMGNHYKYHSQIRDSWRQIETYNFDWVDYTIN